MAATNAAKLCIERFVGACIVRPPPLKAVEFPYKRTIPALPPNYHSSSEMLLFGSINTELTLDVALLQQPLQPAPDQGYIA
jgi:hypothetical protein